jgi:autotransporter-associated beta strand protein
MYHVTVMPPDQAMVSRPADDYGPDSGTLTLTAASTFTDATTINPGTLKSMDRSPHVNLAKKS